jgi:enterochelin esterase-like enzyme
MPDSSSGSIFTPPSLRGRADYLIDLPAGYAPPRRYPVLFLLHGMPGRPQVYVRVANVDVRLDNLVSRHGMPPMIIVLPDGRVGGSTFSDSEWANTPTGNYESYVLDVMHDVDRRFSTIANRDARVIAGYSAGALGALNLALHHLGDFASVQAWSGPFSESRSGVFADGTAAAVLNFSPIDYVNRLGAELAKHPLRAFLYGGRNDADSRRVGLMAARLAAAGASVRYARYPGGHDWQLWNGHLDQMLVLAGRDVMQSPRPPGRFAGSHRPRAQGLRRPLHGHRHAGHAHHAHRHARQAHRHARQAHRHARQAHRQAHRRVGHHARRTRHTRGRSRHRAGAGVAAQRRGRGHGPALLGTVTAAAGARGQLQTPATTAAGSRQRPASQSDAIGTVGLLAGLLLALLSAAAINLGFLLQQHGLRALTGGGQ